MPAPRVSVILNARNGARTVREALDSVLAQTFSDWELIFWDDCSTDATAAIVATYSDPRIQYFLSPQDTPLGAARDAAIRRARGEWLAFIDQDDVWLPDKLERQLALADDESTALIYGRTVAFTDGGSERDFDHRHEFLPLPEGRIFDRLLIDSCYIALSSAMLRRSAVEAVLPIPDQISVTPDYFLFLAIAFRWTARAVQDVVCRYRLHSGSMTQLLGREMHEEALWLLDRWSKEIGPALLQHRREVHNTVVGVLDVLSVSGVPRGLRRIVRRGSLTYLLSRPFARSYRLLRRHIRRPLWKRSLSMARRAEPFDSKTSKRLPVLGAHVSVTSFAQAQDAIARMVESRTPGYVSCANVYSVMMAHDDYDYRRLLNGASFVTADGMPIVWALRALGMPAERVHNDDLFLELCARHRGWRHFFVGGRAGQPEQVAAEVRRRFPGIEIAGTRATPERPVPAEETESILREIERQAPDIVWVGMGTPAQDEWMAAVAHRVAAPMVGVGSLFDLLTGRTKPAPSWMKRSGLQWLFRFSQEPRRLARRYLIYSPRFVWAFAKEWRRHRLVPAPIAEIAGEADREARHPSASPAAVDLSVVIVTHNVAHLIRGCLDSLKRETAGLKTEVFVVDSASSDDTVAVVRDGFPEVDLRPRFENVGFSPGNNIALPDCHGRYVMLLNPDTVVHEGAIRRMIGYLEQHPSAGAVGPRLRLRDGSTQPECARNLPKLSNVFQWLLLLDKLEWKVRFRERQRERSEDPPPGTLLDRFCLLSWPRDTSCEVESICGACMLIRREVIQHIGLLDEQTPMYLDDIDYGRRIRDAGWQIHYVADAEVTHFWGQSGSSRRAGDFYAMGCHSVWLYFRKHDGFLAGAAFAAMALVAGAIRAAICFAVLVLPGERRRKSFRRHLEMALGLCRWAFRFPKTAPRFGFANEKVVQSRGAQRVARHS